MLTYEASTTRVSLFPDHHPKWSGDAVKKKALTDWMTKVLAGASLDSKAGKSGAKDSVVPGLQLVKLPKETLDGFITLVKC